MTSPLNLPAPGRCQTLYFASSAWQSHVFLINSHSSHFSAPQIRFGKYSPNGNGDPFSRSYGVRLPSSLKEVLSSTLGYSPHSPESVYGTVTGRASDEDFLGSLLRSLLCPIGTPHRFSGLTTRRICLPDPPTSLDPHFQSRMGSHSCVPPKVMTRFQWFRNINRISIAYAFRPRLRVRLTLGGLAFPRNP